jgi:hypothetical protein
MEGSSDRLRELLAEYSQALANLSGDLTDAAQAQDPQAGQGARPAAGRGSQKQLPAGVPGRRRRRPRPPGTVFTGKEGVEAQEAREQGADAAGPPPPSASNLPAITGSSEGRPAPQVSDSGRAATVRGLLAEVEETATAIQAVVREMQALNVRVGGASPPTGPEGAALDNQAQAILDVAALSIAMAEEARAAARLAAISSYPPGTWGPSGRTMAWASADTKEPSRGLWRPVSALIALLLILSTLTSDGFHQIAPSQPALRSPVASATSIAGGANATEEPMPFPRNGEAPGSRQTEGLLPPGSTPGGTQEAQAGVPPISVGAADIGPAQAEVLSGTAGGAAIQNNSADTASTDNAGTPESLANLARPKQTNSSPDQADSRSQPSGGSAQPTQGQAGAAQSAAIASGKSQTGPSAPAPIQSPPTPSNPSGPTPSPAPPPNLSGPAPSPPPASNPPGPPGGGGAPSPPPSKPTSPPRSPNAARPASPATPATPASPAQTGHGGTATTPASPATPAQPAVPAKPSKK